jgi:acetylornithine deacetylase/succinyl-diaminopimelate desuccinylase-like protein
VPFDDRWREELAEFIAIPSVSADPHRRPDVRRAAEWVYEHIRQIGGNAELRPIGGHELVLGEIAASDTPATAPTVLCYGHVDVQPPAPLELWESDPFELAVRGEWAYGRGIADDKGQLFILLKAAERLLAANALPVNLRFVCDAEEEVGGTTVVDWIERDDELVAAAVIFDGTMPRRDLPAFHLATRGLITVDVKVRAGVRDLHSGHYGGVALNGVHVLLRCLDAVLARADGLLPDPLRQGISPPTPDEAEAWSDLPLGSERLAAVGARALDRAATRNFYARTWAEPSADVSGVVGGKPGLRSVTIAAEAKAELAIRVAPGQDANAVARAAERLIRAAAPAGAEVDVRFEATPPASTSSQAPAVHLAADAFERTLGVRPRLLRTGGTLPLMSALARRGIPAILTGFAVPESNIHAPNERLLIQYIEQGVDAAAAVFVALAALRTSGSGLRPRGQRSPQST